MATPSSLRPEYHLYPIEPTSLFDPVCPPTPSSVRPGDLAFHLHSLEAPTRVAKSHETASNNGHDECDVSKDNSLEDEMDDECESRTDSGQGCSKSDPNRSPSPDPSGNTSPSKHRTAPSSHAAANDSGFNASLPHFSRSQEPSWSSPARQSLSSPAVRSTSRSYSAHSRQCTPPLSSGKRASTTSPKVPEMIEFPSTLSSSRRPSTARGHKVYNRPAMPKDDRTSDDFSRGGHIESLSNPNTGTCRLPCPTLHFPCCVLD